MHVLASTIREFFDKILQNNQLVPLVLLMGLTMWLLWVSRRKFSERGNEPKRAAAPRGLPPLAGGSNEQIRKDLEHLIAELEQLSRKISAEIDTRFAKLEAAMHDADRRIAALHRLTRQPGGPPTGESATAGPEERYSLIYELADVGFSPVEIARDLGRTPGEVELILNLRNKGGTKASGSAP